MDSKTKIQKWKLRTWAVAILATLVAAVGIRHDFTPTPNRSRDINNIEEVKLDRLSHVVSKPVRPKEEISEQSSQIPNTSFPLTLAEIIRTDNLCAYQKQWSKTIAQAEEIYFDNSQFYRKYVEMKHALQGQRPSERTARLVYYLRLAGLLAHESTPHKPTRSDINEARTGLADLESSDLGNGALIAFQIAITDPSESEFFELLARLEGTNRFDTYMNSYIEELSVADMPSAIGFLIKVGYVSTLPVPDYINIRLRWNQNLRHHPEALSKIAWLMSQDGIQTRRPSHFLGFNVLEYSVGRALIKKLESVDLPNFLEINRRFPQHIDWINKADRNYFTPFADSCDEKLKEGILNYSKFLRERGWGLGMM